MDFNTKPEGVFISPWTVQGEKTVLIHFLNMISDFFIHHWKTAPVRHLVAGMSPSNFMLRHNRSAADASHGEHCWI